MTEAHKKSERLRANATPTQINRILTHCLRLNVSMGSRILELMRQDIVAHHHFDLQIEVGPTRKPRARAAG